MSSSKGNFGEFSKASLLSEPEDNGGEGEGDVWGPDPEEGRNTMRRWL